VGKRVVVVGGGIAGLSVAHAIVRRGADAIVLEASDRAGGYLETSTSNGFLFEHGPQGFLAERPGTLDLVGRLEHELRVVRASATSKRRYVLHQGALRALPTSPPSFLTSPLLSAAAKLRVLAEPWARKPPEREETVREFVSRRLGPEVADVLADAAVTGIYAGDPSRLSARACFAKMTRAEKEYGSLLRALRAKRGAGGAPAASLCSFANGMIELPRALEHALGERIVRGARVTRLRAEPAIRVETARGSSVDADAVVLAIPARHAAELVAVFAPEAARLLRGIVTAPAVVAGLGFARGQVAHPLDGYGFLVPGGKTELLGCLFESTVFEDRAPDGHVMLRVMMGGARQAPIASRDESGWIDAAVASVRGVLGIDGAPVWSRAAIHGAAIPQYEVGHEARVDSIRAALAPFPRVHLAGASYDGVSVNQITANADAVAGAALA
jgi:oxygen-dependent protoporphyrinogen oxidase